MSIASEITRIQNAKASIKTSIENKGVTVGNGTLDTYASKIDAIETGITPTGTINITENGTYDVTDKASANVNVNSGDISEYFVNSIRRPLNNIFKKIPMFAISGDSCRSLFSSCSNITTIPQIDTSNVTDCWGMFQNCGSLKEVPLLNMSKVTIITNLLANDYNLITLGGFQNLGQAYLTTAKENYGDYTLDLSISNYITHNSLMNVINNLYDIASKGVKTQKLILGSKNLAKLTAEEIAIATNKGFSVS